MDVGHNILSDQHPERIQPTALYLDDNPHAAAYALQTADPFCRLGDKGNPSVEHLANKVNGLPLDVVNVGVLNELNHPIEQWGGTPESYAALLRELKGRVGGGRRLWAMAPSPDSPLWEQYLRASYSVTGLQQLHCYGTTLDALKGHYQKQKGIIGAARIRVTEINFGWGNTVDKNRWAEEALKPFLDYLSSDPLCEGAYYFAWDWPAPDTPGTVSVNAIGTRIAAVIDDWKPPVVVTPPAPPSPPQGGTVQVRKLDSTHWSERLGRKVEAIVVHTTEGNSSFEGAARYLVSNERSVSAHELIGDDVVYLMVPDHRAAHHAGSETSTLPTGHRGGEVNLRTYGMETYNTSGKPPSAKAQANLVARVVEACKRFNLPASKVLAHRELDPTRRSDPTGIDMVKFRAEVAKRLGEGEQEYNWRAAAWYVEEAARRARDGGEQSAHDALVKEILPAIYAKRDAA